MMGGVIAISGWVSGALFKVKYRSVLVAPGSFLMNIMQSFQPQRVAVAVAFEEAKAAINATAATFRCAVEGRRPVLIVSVTLNSLTRISSGAPRHDLEPRSRAEQGPARSTRSRGAVSGLYKH